MNFIKNSLQLHSMINKAMEVILKLSKNTFLAIFTFLLFFASTSHAATLYFEGPKVTNIHDMTEFGLGNIPLMKPGDFAQPHDFKGSNNRNDVAVPLSYPFYGPLLSAVTAPLGRMGGVILGLENLDNWAAGINQYFAQKNEVEKNIPLQTVVGQFNGDATAKDLLVVNHNNLVLCFDYHSVCNPALAGAVPIDLFENNDPAKERIYPWSAAIGDIDGDAKDDIVVIGFNQSGTRGFIVHLQGHNDGTAPTFKTSYEYAEGFPLSITLGKFDASGRLGAAVGLMPKTDPGARIFFSKNNGTGTLEPPVSASDVLAGQCYAPTGIVTYDPDANNLADVVLTCFQRDIKSLGNGPVITFKNNLAGTGKFEKQQLIDKFIAPYTSAVGDLNGDSKADLAVADNGGQVVAVFSASANPFEFDVTTYNPLPAFPYWPKYIKIAEMNGADPDLVATATLARLPRFNHDPSAPSAEIAPASKAAAMEFFVKGKSLSSSSYYGITPWTKFEDSTPKYGGYRTVSPHNYEYKYFDVVGSKKDYTQVSFTPFDNMSEVKPDTTAAAAINSLDKPIARPDAVLVYLNFRPQIVPDKPSCENGNTVTIHCLASSGHTINTCTVTTAESWNPNPQVTVVGSGKDVKITLPTQTTPVHFTVTATESAGGNTYTAQIEMLPAQCANPSISCSQTSVPLANVYWDDPWTVCVPDSIASQTANRRIVWSQNAGPDILTPTNGNIMAQSVSTTGNCITGRFNPYTEAPFTVQLSYAIQDLSTGNVVAEGCRADVKFNPALLEGSGQASRCSLDKSEYVRWSSSGLLLLILAPALVLLLRKRAFSR